MLRIGDKNVLFGGKKISLISFTMADCDQTSLIVGTYHAEEGMTWEEFINSDYNNGDFSLDNGYVQYKYASRAPVENDIALLSDVIRDGVGYLYGFGFSDGSKDHVLDPAKWI